MHVPVTTRRRVLWTLGGAAILGAAAPALAQPAPPRIAWISPTRASDGSPFLDELRRGLRELGYAEGLSIAVEAHWGEDSPPRVDRMVAEIVASHPAVIVAQSRTALVVRRATSTLPVVFGYSGDPVEAGLVESFARPGGNLTGISYLTLELVGKRFELLREVLPAVKRVAVVANPQHPGDRAERQASEAGANALGLSLQYFEARSAAEIPPTLAAIEKSGSQAVMFFPVQNVINDRERIAAWAIKHRIPTISGWAQFAEGGNLMSYGPNLRESSRRLAFFVDRILRGAKPADLPVELPTQVELVINQKAARGLGIAIPRRVLLRADRLID